MLIAVELRRGGFCHEHGSVVVCSGMGTPMQMPLTESMYDEASSGAKVLCWNAKSASRASPQIACQEPSRPAGAGAALDRTAPKGSGQSPGSPRKSPSKSQGTPRKSPSDYLPSSEAAVTVELEEALDYAT